MKQLRIILIDPEHHKVHEAWIDAVMFEADLAYLFVTRPSQRPEQMYSQCNGRVDAYSGDFNNMLYTEHLFFGQAEVDSYRRATLEVCDEGRIQILGRGVIIGSNRTTTDFCSCTLSKEEAVKRIDWRPSRREQIETANKRLSILVQAVPSRMSNYYSITN